MPPKIIISRHQVKYTGHVVTIFLFLLPITLVVVSTFLRPRALSVPSGDVSKSIHRFVARLFSQFA
jgi:hypothetical protein